MPEVVGLVDGVAAPVLVVGIANLLDAVPEQRPCFSLGETAGTTSSCGGLDPTPWLVVGVVLAVAGLMSYALARRRS